MKAIIDTSSLVSLVRYYFPFDKNGKLKNFFKERILCKEIVVLDKVVSECKLQGKGQVINAMPFIDKPKYKTIQEKMPLNTKLYNLIDNNFINNTVRSAFPEAEYQLKRDQFVDSADFAMILYAYSIKDKGAVVIVTEETGYSNDGKPFKKIPEICKIIGVPTMNLPTFLSNNDIIDLSVDVTPTTLF